MAKAGLWLCTAVEAQGCTRALSNPDPLVSAVALEEGISPPMPGGAEVNCRLWPLQQPPGPGHCVDPCTPLSPWGLSGFAQGLASYAPADPEPGDHQSPGGEGEESDGAEMGRER